MPQPPQKEVAVRAGSDEGVLGPPVKCTYTQRMAGAHDHCQGQKPRRDTSIALSIKAFLRDNHKNTPLLILQTTFGNFRRKRLSPPQGIRGSKIPLSSAPV